MCIHCENDGDSDGDSDRRGTLEEKDIKGTADDKRRK